MPTPVINYAGQPYSAGATWQTNNAGNFGTQEVTNFVNGSNSTLYTGDVVVIGTSAAADPQAFNVTSTTTVSNPLVVGVVGGMTNQLYAGGPIPYQTPPWRYDSVTTAASTTVTDASCVASDVGKEVVGPGIPSGAYILTVTPGTSFVMNVAATASATVTVSIGPREAAIGPGWMGVPVGEIVPVVMAGWAYINIGGNTVAANALLTTSGAARIASAVVSAATLIGTFIGVALEAQSAGVAGPSGTLIRAWITKF